ncbi:hypothetical protein GCM10011505_36510 [Tistrella bauzanensis]|uniref:Uncharacterized protein n=1 Tax=Tistrella bauzanensis TaxID=657419 RepID=A0ABQ1IXN9_9PROT|nr:hypothetical protein GCM10011505_36510 [Tistrella bauzanensis]
MLLKKRPCLFRRHVAGVAGMGTGAGGGIQADVIGAGHGVASWLLWQIWTKRMKDGPNDAATAGNWQSVCGQSVSGEAQCHCIEPRSAFIHLCLGEQVGL